MPGQEGDLETQKKALQELTQSDPGLQNDGFSIMLAAEGQEKKNMQKRYLQRVRDAGLGLVVEDLQAKWHIRSLSLEDSD